MPVFLNTYETFEIYGGPEEGGWWFDAGEPLQSILVSGEDLEDFHKRHEAPEDAEHFYIDSYYEPLEAETAKFKPTEKETRPYGGYSFMPGSDEPYCYCAGGVHSTYEDHFAERYPTERPHYE